MKFTRSILAACVLMLAFLVTNTAYGQNTCSGNGQCQVEINGVPSVLNTNIQIGWHSGIRTEKTVVSILDYKQLQNSQFSMGLQPGKTSRIVVLSDNCDDLFPATATVEIYGRITYQGLVFTSSDGNPLVLESTASVTAWPPNSTVCYKVQANKTYTNGSRTIVIKAGSTVCLQ